MRLGIFLFWHTEYGLRACSLTHVSADSCVSDLFLKCVWVELCLGITMYVDINIYTNVTAGGCEQSCGFELCSSSSTHGAMCPCDLFSGCSGAARQQGAASLSPVREQQPSLCMHQPLSTSHYLFALSLHTNVFLMLHLTASCIFDIPSGE